MSDWQPIETASKDETARILVWFDHDVDPFHDPANPSRLTDYAAIAEGGDFLAGKGVAVAAWSGGYYESDDGENSYWMPGGWFLWLGDDVGDQVVNATHWMPLPAPPATLEHTAAEAAEGGATC